MYRLFIEGITRYKRASKSSWLNPQFMHHHGSAGVERANLLKEIIMRLLLCGYYEHIETILSLKGKYDSYFSSSITTEFIDQINKNTKFTSKYSAKKIAKILNSGNDNPSSMRTFLKKSLSKTNNKISSECKILSYLYRKHIDHSLMSYKLFAASVQNPLDPFYAKVENRKKMLKHLHMINDRDGKDANLDFMEYDFISSLDLSQDNVYLVGDDLKIYGLPFFFKENKIALVSIVDDCFQMNKKIINAAGLLEIYAFTGFTGSAKKNLNQNQRSVLGYITFHRETKDLTVAFRGSRSGNAVTALLNALFFSCGNADWVTDMEIFNTEWNSKDNNLLSKDYKKIFTSISNINIAYGFATTFCSSVENIRAIIQFLKDEHKAINSISITGHSLGGGLAQVCYLCFKFGVLSELINNSKVYCFPFSAPPVLTKPSIEKLKLLDDPQVIHSYLDSDLVHVLDLDNGIKSKILKCYVAIKGIIPSIFRGSKQELGHFGVNLFAFSTDLYKEKIDFPNSHEYENFYTLLDLKIDLPTCIVKELSEIKNNKRFNYVECLFNIINRFDFNILRESIQFTGLQRKIDVSDVLKEINTVNSYYQMIDGNNPMSSYVKYFQKIDISLKKIIILMESKKIQDYVTILKIYREAIREFTGYAS